MTIQHRTHDRIDVVKHPSGRDTYSLTPIADAAFELAETIACGLGVILLMAAVYIVLT